MTVAEPVLVGVIVSWCAVFSVWRMLSVRARLRVLETLSQLPARAGGSWAAALRTKTLTKLSGGCSTCAGGSVGRKVSANVQPLNRRSAAPRR